MDGAIASAPFLKIHVKFPLNWKDLQIDIPSPSPFEHSLFPAIPSPLGFPPPIWKRSVLSSWRVPLLSSCCFRRSGNPSGELCAVRLLQVETESQKEGARLS